MVAEEQLDDSVLLKHIQDGNHRAFAVLVRRHATRFYRVAYRFLADREEAEDRVQECFLKLWEQPGRWREGKASFTTWFYRVVVNSCLDYRKQHPPLSLMEEAIVLDEALQQEEILLQTEEQLKLEKEIGALPERQRVALNLCFYEGLSNKEAAQVMGVGLKALQSLVMRAKTTLKERLG